MSVVVGKTRDGVTVYADFVMPVVVFVLATLIVGAGAREVLELMDILLDELDDEKEVLSDPLDEELSEDMLVEPEELLIEAEDIEEVEEVDTDDVADDDDGKEEDEADDELLLEVTDVMVVLDDKVQRPSSVPFV